MKVLKPIPPIELSLSCNLAFGICYVIIYEFKFTKCTLIYDQRLVVWAYEMHSYMLLDVNHKYNHANICMSLVIKEKNYLYLKILSLIPIVIKFKLFKKS